MWQGLPFLVAKHQLGHAQMQSESLADMLLASDLKQSEGPIAIIGVEDDVEVATTLRHHLDLGFKTVVALMPPHIKLPRDLTNSIWRVDHALSESDALVRAINDIGARVKEGTWLYYCYNAEFLFYPFCENRRVGELLTFHKEERREAMLSYVVDLYADDLAAYPDAVSLDAAHLDRSGYYALARTAPPHGHPKERQLDFFGGLRWRFEEHIPASRRKIDRVSLFQARSTLKLREDFTFDDEELNTYACPWHNNLTAAVCSFRTAKALKLNPGSRFDIPTFKWHNSAPFEWHSGQLLDLGLMEPGQWF